MDSLWIADENGNVLELKKNHPRDFWRDEFGRRYDAFGEFALRIENGTVVGEFMAYLLKEDLLEAMSENGDENA